MFVEPLLGEVDGGLAVDQPFPLGPVFAGVGAPGHDGHQDFGVFIAFLRPPGSEP